MYLLYQFIICLNIYTCIILRMYNLICSCNLQLKNTTYFPIFWQASVTQEQCSFICTLTHVAILHSLLLTCFLHVERVKVMSIVTKNIHYFLLILQKITHPQPKNQDTKNPITLYDIIEVHYDRCRPPSICYYSAINLLHERRVIEVCRMCFEVSKVLITMKYIHVTCIIQTRGVVKSVWFFYKMISDRCYIKKYKGFFNHKKNILEILNTRTPPVRSMKTFSQLFTELT